MYRVCFTIVFFVLLCGVSHAVPEGTTSVRVEYNFNPQWRLHVGEGAFESSEFNDSDWEQVTLPHAWNEDAAYAVEIHSHPTGIAWYRKRFVLPENATDRKIFLEFEGVRQGGRVYVNGKEAGRHHNGAMAFGT